MKKSKALDELKKAVNCLQKFVEVKKEEQARLNIKGNTALPFKLGPLAKLVAHFVSVKISDKRFKENVRKIELEKKALTGAIDFIKIHHRLIDRLSDGTEEEAIFAKRVHQAIEDYNQLMQGLVKPPTDLFQRISRFLTSGDSIAKMTKLSLPAPARVSITNSEKTNASALDTFERLPHPPRSDEIDLFRMKVIRKIQEKQLLTLGDTLSQVRTCPIDAVTTTGIQKDGSAKGTIVTLRQTCIPLPGEKLDFSLPYDRGEDDEERGVPIGDINYRLTSKQTGFPDPALTSGFGLPECFIPTTPLRPEIAPTLELLLDRRGEVAHALLPQGALNQKAKQHYKLHKQLYDQDPLYFIKNHRTVVEKLVSLLGGVPTDLETIRCYFSEQALQPPTFEELCTPFQLLRARLDGAFEELEGTFFSYDEDEMPRSPAEMRLKLKEVLNQIAHQGEQNPFVNLLENRLLDCCCTYILQSYSEKYNFAPPTLSEVEKRVQSVVFFQQLYFFQQLEKPEQLTTMQDLVTTSHFYFDHILALLKGKAPSPLAELAERLVEEVGDYFDNRYREVGSNSAISLSVNAR